MNPTSESSSSPATQPRDWQPPSPRASPSSPLERHGSGPHQACPRIRTYLHRRCLLRQSERRSWTKDVVLQLGWVYVSAANGLFIDFGCGSCDPYVSAFLVHTESQLLPSNHCIPTRRRHLVPTRPPNILQHPKIRLPPSKFPHPTNTPLTSQPIPIRLSSQY
jgi:hypothetical protein